MYENKQTYSLNLNNEIMGPYTINQLRSMWANGTITHRTPLFRDTSKSWGTVGEISHLFEKAILPKGRRKWLTVFLIVLAAVLSWLWYTGRLGQGGFSLPSSE